MVEAGAKRESRAQPLCGCKPFPKPPSPAPRQRPTWLTLNSLAARPTRSRSQQSTT